MRARIAVLLLFVTAVARAQSLSDSSVKIVYFHKSNHAEVRTVDGRIVQSVQADGDKCLEIHAPQSVPIFIADPNPVFYKYSKGKTTTVPNPNWAAALAFAKAIPAAQGVLEIGDIPGAQQKKTRLEAAIDQLKGYAKQMPQTASDTLEAGTLVTAKHAVDKWDLDGIAATLNDSAALTEIAQVSSSGTTNQGLIPETINNGLNEGTTKKDGETQKKKEPTPTTEQLLKRIDDLEKAVTDAAANAVKLQREQQKRLDDGKKTLDEAKKTLQTLRDFKKAVLAVDVEIELEGESISPQTNATLHIMIEPVPPVPDTQAPARKTGDVKIPTCPYSPVDLGFGAGMVYSFVKAPSFTAEKQDDGKFKIVEKEGKNRAQNVSAMLTITPRAWRNPLFGGAFQLGISPVKDQVGIFGGVQLRIAKYATIGAGYGYQQVPRLDGQTAGDILEKQDALKTSNHYKGGAYVSLLLTLPKEEK